MNTTHLLALLQSQTNLPWSVPPRDFYERDTTEATKALLGCLLVHVIKPANKNAPPLVLGGRIVEVEAYIGENDPACHAARGRTTATDPLYRRGGTAYVYLIYGMYDCVNAVAHPTGTPGAALIRAIEPMFGIDEMLARRALPQGKLKDLCSGPGKLCRALGIDRKLNGADLTAGPLFILQPAAPPPDAPPLAIQSGPRIGIVKAADWPLRFWIAGSPWASRREKTG